MKLSERSEVTEQHSERRDTERAKIVGRATFRKL